MNWTDQDKEWLTGLVKGVEERVNQRFDSKIDAKIDALEAKLLTAFHTWASPMEARQRTHAATLKAIDADRGYLTIPG
jgi:hypothetical protein